MTEKTTKLSSCFNEKAMSVRKRLIVFFLFFCMMINGFVPSTVEVSKYSFIMVAITVTHTGIVTVLKKCNDSLVTVASKVCKEVQDIFLTSSAGESSKAGQSKNNAEGAGANTSDDYAVFSAAKKEDKKTILQNLDNEKYVSVAYKNNIYNMYDGCKSPPINSSAGGLVLLFLVFIAAIRQRKGIDNIIMSINNVWKPRISA